MTSVTIKGRERIQAAIAGINRWLADMSAPFDRVEGYISKVMVSEQFASEGGRTGGWGGVDEVESGALSASLTDRFAPGAVFELSPGRLRRGSDLSYAYVQHHGNPANNLPEHDLFGYTPEDGREMLEIMRDDLTDYARTLGFETA
jgi:hypothetical protein